MKFKIKRNSNRKKTNLKNPINNFKIEVLFWLCLLSIYGMLSSTLNIILNKQDHVLMGYLFLGLNAFFVIFIWIRISLLIQDLCKKK